MKVSDSKIARLMFVLRRYVNGGRRTQIGKSQLLPSKNYIHYIQIE